MKMQRFINKKPILLGSQRNRFNLNDFKKI